MLKLFIGLLLSTSLAFAGHVNFVVGSVPFVPSSVPDMFIGVDPACTITTSQWTDCWSGNSNNLVAGAVKPSTSTLNGQPVLTFATTTSEMKTAANTGITGDAAFTVIVVSKWIGSGAGYPISFGGVGGAGHGLFLSHTTSLGSVLRTEWVSADKQTSVASTTNTVIWVVTKSAGSISAHTTIRLNGADVTAAGGSGVTPSMDASKFYMGTYLTFGTTFDGQVGAAFLFPTRVLTGTEITNFETYLNALFAAF